MGAITSNGAKFYWNESAATPVVPTTEVGQILSLSGPSISVAAIETTDMQDTTKTFIAGMVDGGEVTIEVAYDPDSDTTDDVEVHTELTTDMLAGTLGVWMCEWSDGCKVWGQGVLTAFSPTAAIDDKLTASFTVKVSGAVTFIEAS